MAEKKSTVLEAGWLTPNETMGALNVAERTLRDWAKKGRLRFRMEFRPGKTPGRLYSAADVEKIRAAGPPETPRPQLVQDRVREIAGKAGIELSGKDWVTLDEAKAFLGLSEKSIQRLKRAGHLKVREERREGKMTRLYSGEDLQTIKAKAIPASAIAPGEKTTALAKVQAPIEITIPSATVTVLRELLIELRGEQPKQIAAPVEQLWLSVGDAAKLSGLSEGFLLAAITEGKLAARKGGFNGTWRINRASLEEFRG
jgi:excisionase family DNA binding protein